ncbi:hypothetical protein PPACK8108_LOCUS11343, partial [Phakopsora pachyrhizi]
MLIITKKKKKNRFDQLVWVIGPWLAIWGQPIKKTPTFLGHYGSLFHALFYPFFSLSPFFFFFSFFFFFFFLKKKA